MITNTRTTEFEGQSITTHFEGDVKLEPIETYKWPDEVLKNYAVEDGTVELHYYARIDWPTRDVMVTIGDYVIAKWVLGDKSEIDFTNHKGYGDKHPHSYLDMLPVAIVSDIMGLLWPKM